MAITKIWSVKSRLDSTLNYIANPDKTALKPDIDAREGLIKYIKNENKTEQCKYVTAYGCSEETPFYDMLETQKRFERTHRKNGVVAYHIVQSFKKFETTPEIAHKCGRELVERLFQDKYECVIATHLDHDHLHNHIVINATSFVDGTKYKNKFKDYFVDIRGTSDRICIENCLSVIENPKHRGMHYGEWLAEKNGKSIRQQVREELDEIIKCSYSMKEFWKILEDRGYQITRKGAQYKYTSFIPPCGKKRIRLDKLGNAYTEESILERIIANRNGIRVASPTELPKGFDFGKTYKNANKVKLKGFVALYYHYMYLFGVIKKKQVPQRVSFYMRDELIKFERYKRQFEFMYKNEIETGTQLSQYKKSKEERINELVEQRKVLYESKTEDNEQEIKEKAKFINDELRNLRKEVRMCNSIAIDSYKIAKKHNMAQEMIKQAEMEEKANEHKRRGR
jgi:hypothetical protein